MKICTAPSCHSPHHAKGYCNAHYDEFCRAGTKSRSSPWTQEVRERLAGMLLEGLSATQIAARLSPDLRVSKNAVISVVSRDETLKAIGLQGGVNIVRKSRTLYRKRADAEKNAMKREMTVNKRAAGLYNVSGAAVERSALALIAQIPDDTRDLTARMFGDPLPGRRAIDKAHGRSILMMELKPGECKFPVNDAEPGEMHLFCGLPANPDKPYCATHAFLAYRQQTEHRRAA